MLFSNARCSRFPSLCKTHPVQIQQPSSEGEFHRAARLHRSFSGAAAKIFDLHSVGQNDEWRFSIGWFLLLSHFDELCVYGRCGLDVAGREEGYGCGGEGSSDGG